MQWGKKERSWRKQWWRMKFKRTSCFWEEEEGWDWSKRVPICWLVLTPRSWRMKRTHCVAIVRREWRRRCWWRNWFLSFIRTWMIHPLSSTGPLQGINLKHSKMVCPSSSPRFTRVVDGNPSVSASKEPCTAWKNEWMHGMHLKTRIEHWRFVFHLNFKSNHCESRLLWVKRKLQWCKWSNVNKFEFYN